MPNSYEMHLKCMDVFLICIMFQAIFYTFFFKSDSSQAAFLGSLQYPEAREVTLHLKNRRLILKK